MRAPRLRPRREPRSRVWGLGGLVLLLALCVGLWGGAAVRQHQDVATPTASDRHTDLTAPHTTPLHTLILGDSLTHGYFASGGSSTYRQLLLTRLAPVTVSGTGVVGEKVGAMDEALKAPRGLDLAVVEAGTNDAVQKTPLPTFDAQYRALLARIQKGSPSARLVCLGVWTDTGGTYDDIITTDCTSAGGTFVPLDSIYETPGTRGPGGVQTPYGVSDVFHPNDRGHAAIASAILAVLGNKAGGKAPVSP